MQCVHVSTLGDKEYQSENAFQKEIQHVKFVLIRIQFDGVSCFLIAGLLAVVVILVDGYG